MGFRLSIFLKNDKTKYDKGNFYGDDHKLYGYVSYEDVKESFDYISNKYAKKHKEENISPRDLYDDVCLNYYFGIIKLSEDEFKEFSALYVKDLKHNGSYDYVYEYMEKLCNIPGPKYLEWS